MSPETLPVDEVPQVARAVGSSLAGPPVPTRSLPFGRLLAMEQTNQELLEMAEEDVWRLSEEVADAERRALEMAKEVIDEMRKPEEMEEGMNGSLTWEDVALPIHRGQRAESSNGQALPDSPEQRPEAAEGSQDSKDSNAECIRLQYALQKMKAMMREERSRWNEERLELMQELAQTKQALSEALATDPSVCRSSPSSTRAAQVVPAFGANDNEVEIEILKDNVRIALDAMSAAAPLRGPRHAKSLAKNVIQKGTPGYPG